jgi:hypothetical protein
MYTVNNIKKDGMMKEKKSAELVEILDVRQVKYLKLAKTNFLQKACLKIFSLSNSNALTSMARIKP